MRNLIKKILKEKYESEQKQRIGLLRNIMNNKQTLDQKLTSWSSNPKLMYKNFDQGKESEMEAFKRAQQMGEVRVYSAVKLENIEQYGTKSKDTEQAVSTDKSKSLFGDNDVNVVLSGKAYLMTYYTKDVSTNELGSSDVKLPITPLNPTQSNWDEGIVKNKHVKWDVLFYNPKKFNKKNVELITQKHKLKAVSVLDNNIPQVIKNSTWL